MGEVDHVRVFVIEDHEDNMDLIVSLLVEDVGVRQCFTAKSGMDFFAWIASQPQEAPPVDIVFLDLHIPRENGYVILERIRATPALRECKVIAVTANVMRLDVDRARQSGFDGFIGKPLSFQRFPGQVRRIMAGESVWEPR